VGVPEEAGNGKVKVTISFPDWKEGSVGTATVEVAVAAREKK
jgi:hypothetical protein